jgi:predicted 3-demethylubiquinone-9 3-methyltransferase (glyoxalase superfamily)
VLVVFGNEIQHYQRFNGKANANLGSMTKIPVLNTFLWFPENMSEALEFYKKELGAEVISENRSGETLFTATFSIAGQTLIGMNYPGTPGFNDSISLSLSVDGQDEVDRYWGAITRDGEEVQCGWCRDAFGVSWQIVPIQMHEYLGNPDPEVAAYANQALMKMTKIVIADFVKA